MKGMKKRERKMGNGEGRGRKGKGEGAGEGEGRGKGKGERRKRKGKGKREGEGKGDRNGEGFSTPVLSLICLLFEVEEWALVAASAEQKISHCRPDHISNMFCITVFVFFRCMFAYEYICSYFRKKKINCFICFVPSSHGHNRTNALPHALC